MLDMRALQKAVYQNKLDQGFITDSQMVARAPFARSCYAAPHILQKNALH